MSRVIIQEETTKNPISLIGLESGVCYGSDITNEEKNFRRGLENIRSNHGRTLEFPQIYMVLDGYSAKVIREFYTHIGGSPTRLQSSTRYIEYGNFEYYTPSRTIGDHAEKKAEYDKCMAQISESIKKLEKMGVPKEDASLLLPLGMTTKVVVRTNLRNLIDMSHQRLCMRAYHEYRKLMCDIMATLDSYSPEWHALVSDIRIFESKCEVNGVCPESKGCGRYKNYGGQNG